MPTVAVQVAVTAELTGVGEWATDGWEREGGMDGQTAQLEEEPEGEQRAEASAAAEVEATVGQWVGREDVKEGWAAPVGIWVAAAPWAPASARRGRRSQSAP